MSRKALIVGCGYTGSRVAPLLAAKGWNVTATSRDPGRLRALAAQGVRAVRFEVGRSGLPDASDAVVLLSVPTLPGGDPTPRLVEALGRAPRRVVYLSTTGVYGNIKRVDASTPPAPATERQRLRAAAEQSVLNGPWPSLVLRPAAIYGPGRGVHEAMRQGEFKLMGGGTNYVSRIHVDDLARIAAAAMESDLVGAYPVADDAPCAAREIAVFCAELLGVPLPPSADRGELSETRRADRRVDGGEIRRKLKIALRYSGYREGIPASL